MRSWESVKQSYLKQVRAEVETARHPNVNELLDDISVHLEQKYAELKPDERNESSFDRIVSEMGPASEYAELLIDAKKPNVQPGIFIRFAVNAALSLLIILSLIIVVQIADRLTAPYYGKLVNASSPPLPGEFEITTLTTLQGKYVDKVNYPFVDDPNLLGAWVTVDFVRNPGEFVPGQKRWQWGLFLKGIVFYSGGTTNWEWQWTKGLLIQPYSHTAARYRIKTINGKDYMFFEWKSGDYTILHRKPSYYVLIKVDATSPKTRQDMPKEARS